MLVDIQLSDGQSGALGKVFPDPGFDFSLLDQILAQGSRQHIDCGLPQKLNPGSPFDQAPSRELFGEADELKLHDEIGQDVREDRELLP